MATHRRPLRRRLSIRLAALLRWLHIYLSMLGLAAVLFFGATGLTLNHPGWFAGVERTESAEGTMPKAWMGLDASGAPVVGDSAQASVDDLKVVEHLRSKHAVRGELAEFRVDDAECSAAFKGPGSYADAVIDRETGKYRLSKTSLGLVAVLNDLHKGRDSGRAWSWVVDLSAGLTVLISLTGLALIFYLKMRRVRGLVVAVIGGLALALVYGFGVR